MKLKWAIPAVSDLEAIKDYIAKDSRYYALEFTEKIFDSVDVLAFLPRIGRIVPEIGRENMREILFHNYRIIYHVTGKLIYILGVIHSARDFVAINRIKRLLEK